MPTLLTGTCEWNGFNSDTIYMCERCWFVERGTIVARLPYDDVCKSV